MLKIPTNAFRYILFQRTQYLRLANHPIVHAIDRFTPLPAYNAAVVLEARLFRQRIQSALEDDLRAEVATLEPHLPRELNTWLDIGCGVGLIDVLMLKMLGHPADCHVYLLDKSETSPKVFYDFHREPSYYNSLDMTREFMLLNGVHQDSFSVLAATENNELHIDRKVDLVISLLSWGFHYPIDAYLDAAYGILRAGGRLIVDIRKGTDGETRLARSFSTATCVEETDKRRRICATK